MNDPANRTKSGRFQKGVSGNPSGRPKKTEEQKQVLADLAALAPKIVTVFEDILANGKDTDRIRVAEIILDRTFGKADASIKHEIDDKTNGVLSEIIEAVNRV